MPVGHNIQNVQVFTGLAADWTYANEILAKNYIGIESDTGKMKEGDGVTHWNALGYMSDGFSGISYTLVADEAARLALSPGYGDEAEQLDTQEIWKYMSDVPEGSGESEEEAPSWVLLYPQA